MKRINRRNGRNRKFFLFLSVFTISIFMSVGFAALFQNLEVTGEANLYASRKYLWHKIINEYDSTHSGSFYQNQYESNKYSYIGNGNSNYIRLDNELWRIVSVESDHTIKVVKISSDTSNDITGEFDSANTRDSSSTYCLTPEYGCNSWSSQVSFNGLVVEDDSSLLTYLNTQFYTSLSNSLRSKIVQHDYNVGAVTSGSTITQMLSEESQLTWNGYIGLLNLSDFIYPSNPSASSTVPNTFSANYLLGYANQRLLWTINPSSSDSSSVWAINYDGTQITSQAYKDSETDGNDTYNYAIFPTMYLSSSVRWVSGNGNQDNPFVIE